MGARAGFKAGLHCGHRKFHRGGPLAIEEIDNCGFLGPPNNMDGGEGLDPFSVRIFLLRDAC
eukprot:scaffold1023_cov313-Pinguiococcus_pyrenoidosus.AAC.12